MTDAEKGYSPAAEGGTGAPEVTQKPRFKTNNVNSMFRQTSSETSEGSGTDNDKNSPGPQGTSSMPTASSAKPNTMAHKGRFTLAAKRDHSSHTGSPSPGPAPVSSASNTATPTNTNQTTPAEADSHTTSAEATSHEAREEMGESANEQSKPSSTAARKPSVDYSEEELTNRGISVAGRFHSASNVNWEDEEEDWNPPPEATSMGANFFSAVRSGKPSTAKSTPAPSSKSTTPFGSATAGNAHTATLSSSSKAPIESTSNKSEPAAASEEPANNNGTPWGQRKVTTAKSLGDAIREAKEKGGDPLPGLGGGIGSRLGRSHFSSHTTPSSAGGGGSGHGSDALSRFRIRSGASMMGDRSVPPLNPRSLPDDEQPTFQRASDRGSFSDYGSFGRNRMPYPSEEDVFMFSRPRHAVADSSSVRNELPINQPVITPRPIPDRLRRSSANKPSASTAAPAPSHAKQPVQQAPAPTPQPAPRPQEQKEKENIPKENIPKEDVAPLNNSQTVPVSKPDTETRTQDTVAVGEKEQESSHPQELVEKPSGSEDVSTAEADATQIETHSSATVDKEANPAPVSPPTSQPQPQPQSTSEPVDAEQTEEMHSGLEAARARLEAERLAEAEKERKLKEMREQIRLEIENKKLEEENRKKSRKEELQRKYEELMAHKAQAQIEKQAKLKAEQEELENKKKQEAEERKANAELKKKKREEAKQRKALRMHVETENVELKGNKNLQGTSKFELEIKLPKSYKGSGKLDVQALLNLPTSRRFDLGRNERNSKDDATTNQLIIKLPQTSEAVVELTKTPLKTLKKWNNKKLNFVNDESQFTDFKKSRKVL